MLKLVDSDALTPSTVRRSRSAHASISNDAHYYSEPEFDIDTASTSELFWTDTWYLGIFGIINKVRYLVVYLHFFSNELMLLSVHRQ